jgi:hypothetical protein
MAAPAVLVAALSTAVSLSAAPRQARAAEDLLFCNQPERIRTSGAHADARLSAGRTYRIFYHYRNNSGAAGPLVVAFHGAAAGKPLTLAVQKGVADPQRDPSLAGRQAMARFLKGPRKRFVGDNGGVRFPVRLKHLDVASGVLTVRADQDARLRIYFRNNGRVVPGARVVAVEAPRRDYTIALSPGGAPRYFRIGVPEPGMSGHLNGTYGLVYSFKVNAPPGRTVRVAFSPRGGKSGLVGTIDGVLRQTRIVGATAWAVFSEAVVGKDGLVVTTLPFGGVFYPVELAFHLL